MVSLEKWMILTPLLKLPKNGEDWGKLIVAKIQNITQSGHTDALPAVPQTLLMYSTKIKSELTNELKNLNSKAEKWWGFPDS